MLALQPIYICFTLITGVFRIKRLGDDYDLVGLWKKDELFLLLSTVHKCGKIYCVSNILVLLPSFLISFFIVVAIIYYVANMRATLDLGTSIQPVCTCVFLFVVDFVTFVILFQGVQFTSIGLCGFHLLNRSVLTSFVPSVHVNHLKVRIVFF